MLNDEAAIRQRAYEIWQSEGELHGNELSHWRSWLHAQQEIRGVQSAGAEASRGTAGKRRTRSARAKGAERDSHSPSW